MNVICLTYVYFLLLTSNDIIREMIISHETRELFLRSKTFMNMMQLNQSFSPFTNANILAQTLITEHVMYMLTFC